MNQTTPRTFNDLVTLYERKSTTWLAAHLPTIRRVSGKTAPIGLHAEAIQLVYRRRIAADDAALRAAQQAFGQQDDVQRLLRAFALDATLRARLKALPAGPDRDAAMHAAFAALGV